MLEAHREFLHRCTVCHDQCLFTTSEVFASGRMTLATSRKALLIEAVLRGDLDWTPSVVEVMYAGLSSGVQHAVCVDYGDPSGWSDETAYLRAARAEIVRAGRAPGWADALRSTWQATGSPYGPDDGPGPAVQPAPLVFLIDAATRAFQPGAGQAWLDLAAHFGLKAGFIRTGSSGFELFDLGFEAEAHEAAASLAGVLHAGGILQVVSDSPEAVYMIRQVWPEWGLPLEVECLHAAQWLARVLEDRQIFLDPSGDLHAYLDPSCLGRYLGERQAPRRALDRLGVNRVELVRHGQEALPSGSYHGDQVGAWVREIARQRCADARAVGAGSIITASPFDYRNLSEYGDLPVAGFGELAVKRLT